MILDVPGSRYRALLDERCAAAGVVLKPKAEIEGLRLIASLAFTGFGAAILPASAAPFDGGDRWGGTTHYRHRRPDRGAGASTKADALGGGPHRCAGDYRCGE
jgi:hypothetical protein